MGWDQCSPLLQPIKKKYPNTKFFWNSEAGSSYLLKLSSRIQTPVPSYELVTKLMPCHLSYCALVGKAKIVSGRGNSFFVGIRFYGMAQPNWLPSSQGRFVMRRLTFYSRFLQTTSLLWICWISPIKNQFSCCVLLPRSYVHLIDKWDNLKRSLSWVIDVWG